MASYNFFWNTKIDKDRQDDIEKWLESLSDDESAMFNEIMKDKADDDNYNSMMSM